MAAGLQSTNESGRVVQGRLNKLYEMSSKGKVLKSFSKLLKHKLTKGCFLWRASLVVTSSSTSAPVGTAVWNCWPVHNKSSSYGTNSVPFTRRVLFFLRTEIFFIKLTKINTVSNSELKFFKSFNNSSTFNSKNAWLPNRFLYIYTYAYLCFFNPIRGNFFLLCDGFFL